VSPVSPIVEYSKRDPAFEHPVLREISRFLGERFTAPFLYPRIGGGKRYENTVLEKVARCRQEIVGTLRAAFEGQARRERVAQVARAIVSPVVVFRCEYLVHGRGIGDIDVRRTAQALQASTSSCENDIAVPMQAQFAVPVARAVGDQLIAPRSGIGDEEWKGCPEV